MKRTRRILLLAAGLLLPGLAALQAQDFFRGRGWRNRPVREGLPVRGGKVDRNFTFCRLYYDRVRREDSGSGWRTDYPGSDMNFTTRIEQLTTVRVARWEDGDPGFAVVEATDPRLFECPFLFASDVGTAGFDDEEVARLREYLLKGGFLWADDFWGERAWDHWAGEIGRILPDHVIVDIPVEHAMLHALYRVTEIPQIPNISFWRRSGGAVSERGAESAVPDLRGIFDEDGRLLVLMSHDTDIADGWEREGEDKSFFDSFSPDAYAFGINVVVWAMTR
jgi:hypothetical protein